jgi:methyl-accepting chemotaxis protein
MQAIHKSQAVIEFELDGTIITANENFLQTVGYSLGEIRGKRHSMFVDSAYGASREYRDFWDALKRGEYQSGEFKRVGKQGQDIWIQASYNPILDLNGRPYKVVKYATNIIEQKQLQHSIESVLEKTLAAMVAMANGDLTHRMEGKFSGQFASLQQAVNDCFSGLNTSLSEIRSVADNVTQDITDIAEGNSNLSERTIEQAANLEETAASMQQITNTVQHNAENATKANELAHRASDQARKGGSIVRNAVDAMNGLNESSVKISDIIGVINDIAFQTNLLALNASVEAARAGDQGRGFAVVASEVRVLAGRSAAAAKQIKELIEESAQRVDESSALVNKSGDSLSEIVAGVEEVTNIVGSISEASNEQSIGVKGVHGAINHVDELTQQNASLVAQAASASQNLNGQAHELVRLVSKFRLSSDVAQAPVANFDDGARKAA